ncbi:MAG: glycosyltransferase family 4 protein, partial [Planctomycetes bacterium]|nr:glycosyltransferase family 4 protein [Planctomycetota bacterium]
MKTKIKLSYDVRMVANSGIGTQVQNVLNRIILSDRFDLTLLGDPENIGEYAPSFQGRVVKWNPPIYSLLEQQMPRRPGILLSPHYNVTLRSLKQTVVVLHDLIHLHSEEFNRPHYRLYANVMLRSIARRARRIVTVSQFTADDFTRRFPRGKSRTLVNHNGLDHRMFKKPSAADVRAFREKYSLPDSFILTVGIGKRHKNVDFVIRSLAPLWDSGEFKT